MIARRLLTRISVCLLLFGAIGKIGLAADNWPGFRGPNGAAAGDTKDAATIPTKWSKSDYNWKIELPGTGAD